MPVPKNFVLPARMSAKERAFAQIQKWIIDGTLQPGEKIMDAELAETLAVSRTPIREALQLLEIQGLVSMYPGKETRVKQIEKDDILKLYPTLAALHALGADYAAQHVSSDFIEQLKKLNMQFEQAIENGLTFEAMETDEQFHNLIVELSENEYVASFSASLQIHIRRFKYVFLQEKCHATKASVEEHNSLINALQQQNAKEAAVRMKQNIIRPMHELYAFIK
ncbi:DNA-binding transcriptional regulator, GntR family [Gracilibacillus orientalis]|uniref:DNA-binding transcriptional regulator, GntR family n=1 Tax=Gracilibacillus orientalis TaxID=334253 RepID=A0A1I4MHS1_9BACI|nr:GntR family transcriptional regulator [Gracilibacillus orientalis]SFM02744.1 DNA-binding transcriptional regulator, GntR family [Gracilibacillus orientalis]